ncbi:hypothetical protein Tco_1192998 [Tanacetum coccineum]
MQDVKDNNGKEKGVDDQRSHTLKKTWSVHDDILAVMKRWDINMVAYYKQSSKQLVDKGGEVSTEVTSSSHEEEDVYNDETGIGQIMDGDMMNGMDRGIDENVNVNIVYAARQSMLCHVGTVKGDLKMYYAFVYDANSGNERKMLWKDLEIYKRIVGNIAWAVLGDMNVTLDLKEHLIGSSNHCSTVFAIPNVVQKRKKAFRFANFTADNENFLSIDKDLHEKKLREGESVVLKGYVEAMKSGNHKNKINCIQDELGNKYEGEDIANKFVRHFHKFLGESFLVKDGTFINALISKRLSDEDAYSIVKELSDAGIKIVREFFKTGKSLKEINSTLISLVSKTQNPKKDKVLVNIIKEAIEEFGFVYGFLPNYSKSTIIFGSMTEEEKKDILEEVPFKVEKLPIRYLGVPLTSKRISLKDCKSLLDKVKNKILNWMNKSLSYAGRL